LSSLRLGDRPSDALSLARTELVFAALRVVAVAVTAITLVLPSAPSLPAGRGPELLGAGTAVLVVVLALLALVVQTRTADGLRRVGAIATYVDVVLFAGWTMAFHDVPGASAGLLGVLVFIEGPVRWGLRGAGVVGVVTAVAAVWPQVDANGLKPPASQTFVVAILLFAIIVVVTTFLRRTAAQVRQAHEQFLRVFEASSTGMALLTKAGRIAEGNRALAASFGLAHEQLTQTMLADLAAEPSRPALQDALEQVAAGGHGARLEARFVSLAGHPFDAMIELTRIDGGPGVPPMISAQIDDVSERKAFEQRLSHQASHDALTGLPNRAFLRARLEEALAPRPGWAPCAVLFCDLDRFKRVNDSLGHDLGDALLVETAGRLARVTRPGDVVGRLGGDEFVVLMHSVWTEADVMPLAERVLEVLRAPVFIDGHELHSGGSVGIALARPGDTPEVLLRDADTAMYRAKEAGGGCAVMFSPSMRTELLEQQELETAFRQALTDDALALVFQVGVELTTGRVALVEALLRWPDPRWIGCTPSDLVAAAEDSGLAGHLGAWVVSRAVAEAASWRDYDGLVTVNASSRQVADPLFVSAVQDALATHDLPASRLCIEVTEDTLTTDGDIVAGALRKLRGLGVRVAIDDFGTGHASLSRLARMPVDVLKIDRAFTRGVANDAGHRAIVEGIIGMARAFGLTVVAEGVETADQLAALRSLGADLAQGYLLAEPVGADAVSERLATPKIVKPRSPVDSPSLTR
jgi:diguanylate cyclase (GGDEF)-like protein/PAS domain S-box-containing protein